MKEQINILFFNVLLYDGSSGVLHMTLAENNPKQKEECIIKPAEDEQCISDSSEALQGSELLRYHHVSYETDCEKGSEKYLSYGKKNLIFNASISMDAMR